MREYRLFGGILRSELELPSLPAVRPGASGPVDWTLEVRPGPPREPPGVPLGEDRVTPDARVRLHRAEDGRGLLLAFDDTGVFHLTGDGSRIRWIPADRAVEDDARLDLLGRVLPLALHLRGLFVLHASAVAVDGRAVALVGPGGHGKSTLAHALVRRGATLLTDDALPVRPEPAPTVLPGVRRLRLRPDAADAVPGLAVGAVRRGGRTEVAFEGEAALRGRLPVKLGAVYLLDPRPPEGEGPAATLERLEGPRAAAVLLSQAKLGPLLAPWSAGELLRQASAIAGGASVRRLGYVRDLSRLDRVAELVLQGGRAGGTGAAAPERSAR